MLKIAAVAALAVAPVSASVDIIPAYPMVERVQCDEGSGSSFTAGGKTISAAHVTTLSNCHVGGRPLNLANEGGDFSVGSATRYGYKINCEGFKPGEAYFAVGYAFGLYEQTVVRIYGTGKYAENGMAILVGFPTVIPGMSGGVLLNSKSEAVGVINMYSTAYPLSFSRELKGTSVCQA